MRAIAVFRTSATLRFTRNAMAVITIAPSEGWISRAPILRKMLYTATHPPDKIAKKKVGFFMTPPAVPFSIY
jgi:hypothetical protein